MNYQPILLTLITLTAFIALGLAIYAWRHRRSPGAEALSLLMLSATAYALPYLAQLSSADLQTVLFWFFLSMPGATALTPLWFGFCLQVTGRGKWLSVRNRILLGIIPVFTSLLAWTNDFHGLFGSDFRLEFMGSFSVLKFSYGLNWINLVYAFALGFIGTGFLVWEAVGRRRFYRGQTLWLLGGTLLPLVTSLAFYVNITALDLSPFSFLFSGIAWSIAVFRLGFLDIVPVARGTVFERMPTGVIVLDHNDRITDFNPAACSIVGCTKTEITARKASRILPSIFRLDADVRAIVKLESEPLSGDEIPPKYVECQVSPLTDSQGRSVGKLILLQDVTARELAGMALREREKDFRFLFENVPVSLWEEDFSEAKKYLDQLKEGGVNNLKGYFETHPEAVVECARLVRIVNVNETTVQMLRGATKEDIAGLLDVIITPESINLFKNELVALSEGETTFESEARDKRLDGSEIIFRVHLSVAPGFEETWEKIIVTIRDITEEKYAERALKESEERFRAVVEDQTELICRFSLDGIVTFANDPYCQFYGKPREDIIGRRYDVVIPEEHREGVRSQIASLNIEYPVTVSENPNINVKGETRWHNWTNRAIFDDEGNIIEYQAVASDITDRVMAEIALQESEEKYRLVVENANEAIFVAQDGMIKFFNPIVLDIVGYSQEELAAMPFVAFIHPDDREMVVERHLQRLKGESPPQIYAFRIINKSGAVRWVEINPVLIEWEGSPATLNFLNDITERKAVEDAFQAERERAQKYLDIAGVLIVALDNNGEVTLINQMGCEILGYKEGEIVGKSWFDHFIPGAMREDVKNAFIRLMVGEIEPLENYENPVLTKGGEEKLIAWHNALLMDENDKIVGSLSSGADITERRRIEDALRASEDQLRTFFEYTSVGMVIADLDGRFLRVNRAIYEMLGYTEEELLKKTFQKVTHPDDLEADLHKVRQLLSGEIDSFRIEKRYLNKGGGILWVMLDASIIRDANGSPLRFIGQINDISERKKAEEQLRYLATHDILTDLPNRGLLFDRLDHAITNAKRMETCLAVLFMDLDNFKLINDTSGHQAGDQVLQMVAERLNECARESDTVARMGGDEFTLLLENLPDPKDAVLVAEKIMKALARPFEIDDRSFSVAASLGISIYPQDGEDGEALLMKADAAMYRAKESHETIVKFR